MFDQKTLQQKSLLETLESSREVWANPQLEQIAITQRDSPAIPGVRFKDNEQVISYASHFAFSTFTLILEQQGNKNVLSSVHTFLAFIWSSALIPQSMMHIQADIPWTKLAIFLNTLIQPETEVPESNQFPIFETGSSKQLPEDFLIRGLAWSQLYYPENFFLEAFYNEDRNLELPSVVILRTQRCLRLGICIASVSNTISVVRHSTDSVSSLNAGSRMIHNIAHFLPHRLRANSRC